MKTTWMMLLLLAALVAAPAHANDWYVDGRSGVDGPGGNCDAPINPRGSSQAPFQNFWCALHRVSPGDTIHILPTTTYSQLYVCGNSSCSKTHPVNGTAAAPITIQGDGPASQMTKVNSTAQPKPSNFAVYIDSASYLTIRNLDVVGVDTGFYIKNSHHIVVAANLAHDSGNVGIQTYKSDYLTITGNRVYNNAANTANGVFGSGISVLQSMDTDSNTNDYKVIIDGNVIYHNYNTPRKQGQGCSASGDNCNLYGSDSDGNGIILDRNNGSVPKTVAGVASAPYRGRILVANNVIFNNGGRGIHVYLSNHTTIVNNTLYNNNQDPYEGSYNAGEIGVIGGGAGAVGGGDVRIYNNILYSDGKSPINPATKVSEGTHTGIMVEDVADNLGEVVADNNLIYNPQHDSSKMYSSRKNSNPVNFHEHNRFADPQFAKPGVQADAVDFHVASGSPANNAGERSLAPANNVMNERRAEGASVNIGAY